MFGDAGATSRGRRRLGKYMMEKHPTIVSILLFLHAILLGLPGFLLLTIPIQTMQLLQWEVCNLTVIRICSVMMLTMAFLSFHTIQTPPMLSLLSFTVLIVFDVGISLAILLSLVEDESARNWSFSTFLILSIIYALIWVHYRGQYESTARIRQMQAEQEDEDEAGGGLA